MILNFSVDLMIKLAVATLLGGILGLEREIHGRPAGLRTHLLVSLGAAAFMVISPLVASMGKDFQGDPGLLRKESISVG